MARTLIAAMRQAGHRVDVASELRTFAPDPDEAVYQRIEAAAAGEAARLAREWSSGHMPDLWFCYHPYYKAPDFIGASLVDSFGIPSVTAEASWSERRNVGAWVRNQRLVADSVRRATVNVCFRKKDRDGLSAVATGAVFAMLPPFVDTARFGTRPPDLSGRRIVTVAMMRPGDKLDSYRMLARALERIVHLPWSLAIAGDGPCRDEVLAEFARLDPARIEWRGEVTGEDLPAFYAGGCLYAWPGCGEAYGLAYLEAQASGLPVVAQATDGVPEVVRNGQTGLLTPPRDIGAFADAIAALLENAPLKRRMSAEARRFATEERSFAAGTARLAGILDQIRLSAHG